MAEPTEAVNHPDHYGGDVPYEVIKIIVALKLGFRLGNAFKYIARAGKKGGPEKELEDLKKAAFYIQHKIDELEGRHAVAVMVAPPGGDPRWTAGPGQVPCPCRDEHTSWCPHYGTDGKPKSFEAFEHTRELNREEPTP